MSVCILCHKKRQKEYRKNNPRYVTGLYRRKYMLKNKYGLTEADYEAMLKKQGGLCAICNADRGGNRHGTDYLAVDHCHDTGKVRGLLCQKCNHGLGKFNDDLTMLRKAAQYLEDHADGDS